MTDRITADQLIDWFLGTVECRPERRKRVVFHVEEMRVSEVYDNERLRKPWKEG